LLRFVSRQNDGSWKVTRVIDFPTELIHIARMLAEVIRQKKKPPFIANGDPADPATVHR